MNKKKNSGFTLVELLICMAILAVVMLELMSVVSNTSKIYKDGTYEVNLQMEAQQIIQQLEDLMVDARTSISHNYVATISSDNLITIKTTNISDDSPVQYDVMFSKAIDDPYGTLTLKITDSSGTVEELMADYVASISLNDLSVSSNDTVSLNIVMQNEKYSYAASQDIFLRNYLGTHREKRGNQSSSTNINEVEVMRFSKVDMKSALADVIADYEQETGVDYQYSYSFKFDDTTYDFPASGSNNIDNYYKINGQYISCGAELNSKFDFEIGGAGKFVVICTATCKDASSGKVLSVQDIGKLQIGTQAVQVGLGSSFKNDNMGKYGTAAVYSSTLNGGGDHISAIPFTGIDISSVTDVKYSLGIVEEGSFLEFYNLDDSGSGDYVEIDPNSWNVDLPGKDLNNINLPSSGHLYKDVVGDTSDYDFGKMYFYEETNSLYQTTEHSYSSNASATFLQIENEVYLVAKVSIKFEDPVNDTMTGTLDFPIYYLAINTSRVNSSDANSDVQTLTNAMRTLNF